MRHILSIGGVRARLRDRVTQVSGGGPEAAAAARHGLRGVAGGRGEAWFVARRGVHQDDAPLCGRVLDPPPPSSAVSTVLAPAAPTAREVWNGRPAEWIMHVYSMLSR